MALFLILVYADVCVVHLMGCILEKDKLCARTKCCLMPLLALAALKWRAEMLNAAMFSFASSKAETQTVAISMTIALMCATAGDGLLLREGDGAFMAGALCFLAGHIAWMLPQRGAIMAFPPQWGALGLALTLLFLIAARRILGKPRGVMGAGVMLYGFCLCALVLTGAAAVYSGKGAGAFMFLAGGILFLVSDGILAYDRFASSVPHSRFLIMLTYIAAQTLLAISSIYMYI